MLEGEGARFEGETAGWALARALSGAPRWAVASATRDTSFFLSFTSL